MVNVKEMIVVENSSVVYIVDVGDTVTLLFIAG